MHTKRIFGRRVIAVSASVAGWCVLLVLAAVVAAPSAAQTFPARPVRLVVPYPAGASSNDILARQIAPRLAELWGQNVVVDNRPGAAGNIGAEVVARAPADGYTLLLGTTGLISIGPSVYTKLTYSPHRDLAPVTLFAIVPYMIVINPSVPAKNIQEFIAYAKARPGKLSFASAGVASTPHLCGELLKSMGGIDMLHVPYKGGAPATMDTIAGQTQVYCAGLASQMPQVKAGKLRTLGITTLKRSAGAPDMPTLDEQGLKGFDVNSWAAILVPAQTPKAVIDRLHQGIARVVSTPEMKSLMIAQGTDPVVMGPAEFAAYIRQESAKWAKVVKAAGIRAD